MIDFIHTNYKLLCNAARTRPRKEILQDCPIALTSVVKVTGLEKLELIREAEVQKINLVAS